MTFPDVVTIAGQTYIPKPAPVVVPRWVGWRVKHRSEPGARQTPNGMPEVNPSINIAGIPFTREMQILSWEVMHLINPTITEGKWRAVFDDDRAYTNEQGFSNGDDPRADYINGQDLGAELPKLMRAILAGGAFIRGAMGSELTVTPGIGAVDCTKPLPSAQEVIDRHWYFDATTARYNAAGEWCVNPFPQGSGGPVAVVYFLNQPARYVGSWFAPWDSEVLPDPYKVYLA
jgi:hypothetical protein